MNCTLVIGFLYYALILFCRLRYLIVSTPDYYISYLLIKDRSLERRFLNCLLYTKSQKIKLEQICTPRWLLVRSTMDHCEKHT